MRFDQNTGQPASFLRNIEGSRGTLVLGNGIDALEGEVITVGHDYVEFETRRATGIPKTPSEPVINLVPFHAIAYYRFAGEE